MSHELLTTADLEADGEWLQRHRNFEMCHLVFPPRCAHPKDRRAVTVTGKSFMRADGPVVEYRHSRQGPFPLAQRLMGIDWMTRDELALAIPPAYTEWIGRQLLVAIERAA